MSDFKPKFYGHSLIDQVIEGRAMKLEAFRNAVEKPGFADTVHEIIQSVMDLQSLIEAAESEGSRDDLPVVTDDNQVPAEEVEDEFVVDDETGLFANFMSLFANYGREKQRCEELESEVVTGELASALNGRIAQQCEELKGYQRKQEHFDRVMDNVGSDLRETAEMAEELNSIKIAMREVCDAHKGMTFPSKGGGMDDISQFLHRRLRHSVAALEKLVVDEEIDENWMDACRKVDERIRGLSYKVTLIDVAKVIKEHLNTWPIEEWDGEVDGDYERSVAMEVMQGLFGPGER